MLAQTAKASTGARRREPLRSIYDESYSFTPAPIRRVALGFTIAATSTLNLDGKIRPIDEKMSSTYELYQKGKQHLAGGMPAQAIVSL